MTFDVHTDPDDAGDGAAPTDSPAGRDTLEPSQLPSSSAVATAGPSGDTPTDLAAEVSHPLWCDRQACTAKPAPSLDNYTGHGDYGRHVSAVVGVGCEAMQLYQQVAPWATSTFLKLVQPDGFAVLGSRVSVDTFGRHLAELGALPSGPLTEDEQANGRRLAGYASYTRESPDRFLEARVRDLVTAEQVDPVQLVRQLRLALAAYTALSGGEAAR